jgi:hypothetical protein
MMSISSTNLPLVFGTGLGFYTIGYIALCFTQQYTGHGMLHNGKKNGGGGGASRRNFVHRVRNTNVFFVSAIGLAFTKFHRFCYPTHTIWETT